jgi:hypothetical protein
MTIFRFFINAITAESGYNFHFSAVSAGSIITATIVSLFSIIFKISVTGKTERIATLFTDDNHGKCVQKTNGRLTAESSRFFDQFRSVNIPALR